jgi:hypothetical protein
MADGLNKLYDQKFKVALELDKGGAEVRKQTLLKQQKTLQTDKEKLQKQWANLQAQRQAQEKKVQPNSDTVDMSPPLRSRSGKCLRAPYFFLSLLHRRFTFPVALAVSCPMSPIFFFFTGDVMIYCMYYLNVLMR